MEQLLWRWCCARTEATNQPLLFVSLAEISGSIYGLRRRKNCGLLVAGRVTDLLVPSSVTLAAFVTQLAGAASVPACSNAKLAVSIDGQETITFVPERSSERVGRVGR